MAVQVALSLMPEAAFAAAALPLFADGLVDAVEHSPDTVWGSGEPDWLAAVLDDHAGAGTLLGHGVTFSLLSAHPRQDAWLQRLGQDLARRPYRRVSEHLGWMAAGPVRRSSPLPLPRTPDVVAHGRRQLARLADVVGAPVGLENLATALGPADVRDQGGLLADLLAPTDGWLVLDLHNLWCQAVNAGLDAGELLGTYPLTRVREVHVSGGSWWSPAGSDRRVRRDTHDGPVPDEVLALLPRVLRDCPGLETVVVEQVGRSLGEPAQDAAFRDGFRTVRALCGRPA